MNSLSTPWASYASLRGTCRFAVRCRQQLTSHHWDDRIETVYASTSQEALNKVRETYMPNLKRETELHTTGPRGGRLNMKITLADIRRAREPKPEQLELFHDPAAENPTED